jgi:histone acetyltransferase (RNA polymerase elongator complex component)
MARGIHILPFFIPHLGCPQKCIFCNQHSVTGRAAYPKEEEIVHSINNWEGDSLPEIAFYGGSFTGLSFQWQKYFLYPAFHALKAKKIMGIRVSTRPDYINKDVLDLLSSFGVNTVELGVQSLDEEVLSRSCRGHTVDDVIRAVALLKKRGFRVGVQLMPGLPGDNREKSILGAFKIAGMEPNIARIYPTLVLKDTLLHKLFLEENYKPLSLDEAVDLSKDILAIFLFHKIQVIRIGLHPTKDITQGAQVAAGPFHPAFGELVESALMREQIIMAIKAYGKNKKISQLMLFVNYRDCSLAAGHKKKNINFLKHNFQVKQVKILGRDYFPRGTVGISGINGNHPELLVSQREFLHYYVTRRLMEN